MGLAATQAVLLMFTARKSDLEFQIGLLQSYRLRMSNTMMGLLNLATKGEKSAENDYRLKYVQEVDKGLELKVNLLNTQLQAVTTQIEGVKKTIERNIQMGFRLGANA